MRQLLDGLRWYRAGRKCRGTVRPLSDEKHSPAADTVDYGFIMMLKSEFRQYQFRLFFEIRTSFHYSEKICKKIETIAFNGTEHS